MRVVTGRASGSREAMSREPESREPARLDRWLAALANWPAVAWLRRGPWDALVFTAFTVDVVAYMIITGLPMHRLWTQCAVFGYAAAAIALWLGHLRWPARLGTMRAFAVGAAIVGAILVPIIVESAHGMADPEIPILVDAAHRLLHTGTPFPSFTGLGDVNANDYNVYLPVMALFGVPGALSPGHWFTDPRLFLAIVSFGLFALFASRGGTTRHGAGYWAALFLICPWVAVQFGAGATDVPVIGALCLGLVLAGGGKQVGRPLSAGVAIGLAAGAKALAWPAIPVLLILVFARRGWRSVVGFLAVVSGTLLVVLGLPALVDPKAFVVNAIQLPLGMLPARLSATSPLPGHLLADAGSVGHAIDLALLASVAIALVVGMLRHPPRDYVSAARWLALGLLAAILLAPSSRWGYLIYPGSLLLLPVFTGAFRWPTTKSALADDAL
ncbi:MAG: hypothetical protein J2O49_02090 [Sciscionella sp.]|nr:hypothetical protein [Sciscionella sp.]